MNIASNAKNMAAKQILQGLQQPGDEADCASPVLSVAGDEGLSNHCVFSDAPSGIFGVAPLGRGASPAAARQLAETDRTSWFAT